MFEHINLLKEGIHEIETNLKESHRKFIKDYMDPIHNERKLAEKLIRQISKSNKSSEINDLMG